MITAIFPPTLGKPGRFPKALKVDNFLRTFQQTPKGAYPRPPFQTVYDSEFLSFGGERGCLGYAKQGYVGVPLETCFFGGGGPNKI